MWNKWNKTGKIKAIILIIIALPNILAPIGAKGPGGIAMVIMPLIFGSIALPLIMKFNEAVMGRQLIRPLWNDNPLTFTYPLRSSDFGARFFIVIGISILIGTGIKFHALSNIGLTVFSFGVGILIGIEVALKWAKKKE